MADIQMGETIANRIRTGDMVIATIDAHAAEIASKLRELNAGLEPLELTPSQVEPFLKALSALLHAATRELESKERAYMAELADDVAPRLTRDELTERGAALMSRARELIAGALGADGLERYGLTAPITRAPREVALRMRSTIDLLLANPATGSDDLGTPLESATVAVKLEEVFQPLEEALATLDREAQEEREAAEARDETIAAWSDIYQGVAEAISGLCRLAGRADLADRLHPTPDAIAGRSTDARTSSG